MSLSALDNIMFNTRFINNVVNNNKSFINKQNDFFFNGNQNKNDKHDKNDKKENFISINDKDTAFWCFYILNYGIESYNDLYNKKFVTEKEIKIKTIEKIKKNPQLLKNFKLKPVEIELALLNDNKIGIECLFALCIYNDINIMVIKNMTYYEIKVNDDEITDVIHLNNDIFSYEKNADINKYSKHYLIENIRKPIKSASSYKVDELIEICKKLSINVIDEDNKKKTKTKLYSDILTKI